MPSGQPFTSLCQELARPRSAGRADLHVHTTASDGAYTPAQIVDLARRSGLSAIAITDHDTVQAIDAACQAAAGAVEVISGVEITAEFRGKEIHLLGYFFRSDDAPLSAALSRLGEGRKARFAEMLARLRGIGVPVDGDQVCAGSGTLGRRHVAELLVKAGRAGSIRQAFARYLGDRGRVHVPKCRLRVEEAIALVRQAGGIASWAHPFYDCTEESLRELRNLGLQAVESEYPSCRPGRRRELRSLASRLELCVTGGSDCHGPGTPHRALGACGISAAELEKLRERLP